MKSNSTAIEGRASAPCSPSSKTPLTDAKTFSAWMWDTHKMDYVPHGVGVPAEFCRKLETALTDAAELLAEIMRDEVNHQDEAEKWLRAYAPQHFFPENEKSPSVGATENDYE
jgi:hypothetical protein